MRSYIYIILGILTINLTYAKELSFYPEEIRLGNIPSNQIETAEIVISNNTKTEIKITNLISDCGCTIIEPSSRDIPPGEFVVLSVQFDSGLLYGEVLRTIHVVTNVNTYSISLSANVTFAGDWEINNYPAVIDLRKESSSVIKLSHRGDFEIVGVETHEPELFNIVFGKNEVNIEVNKMPTLFPYISNITIVTNNLEQKLVNVPVILTPP